MKFIAQILAFYFFLGSLLPGSDYGQWQKVPAVWEHYKAHREMTAASGEECSLLDFLYNHFWDPNSHQHDDGGQSHQGLPFKTVHVFAQILPTGALQLLPALLPPAGSRSIPHRDSFSGAIHQVAVFRPPILS